MLALPLPASGIGLGDSYSISRRLQADQSLTRSRRGAGDWEKCLATPGAGNHLPQTGTSLIEPSCGANIPCKAGSQSLASQTKTCGSSVSMKHLDGIKRVVVKIISHE